MDSWKELVLALSLIAGSLTAAAMHEKELAFLLAGAAAGYATHAKRNTTTISPRDP